MAKTPAERMEELAEEIRKLTDVDEQLVKLEEKKVTEARKTKAQLESFDNLGKQLKDSVLAPLRSLAKAIPEPLRLLGKMAIKPLAVPFLRGKLGAEAEAGGARPGAGPEGGGLFKGGLAEAMGREMSQKGVYGGAWSTVKGVAGFSKSMRSSEDLAAATLNTLKEVAFNTRIMKDDIFTLVKAGSKEGSIFVHDASVEEKLEEIDENTEPKKVSKAKIKEDELEARKKKPGISIIKKIGPVGLDWKKLLGGLALMGAAFGIAKAIAFWKDVIIPAGGFQKWWKDDGWPSIKEWAIELGNKAINGIGGIFGVKDGAFQNWWDETAWPFLVEKGKKLGTSVINGIGAVFGVKDGDFKTWWEQTGSPMMTTLGLALMTTMITAITEYINKNKEAWLQSAKDVLGNLPQKLIGAVTGITVAGWAGMKIGGLLGATAGGIGAIPGAIAGLLVGMAIGAIVGWLGGDIWANMQKATEKQLNTFWAKKREAAAWGAIAGVTVSAAMIAALALAPVTGGLSIPAMIAFVLLSAGVGALWKFITGGFDPTEEKLPEQIQKEMQLMAERAKMGWFGKLWAWIKDSLMWKPFMEGSAFEQAAARQSLKPEFSELSPGVEVGLWQNIQDKMSAAYDAMNNLISSIDAQIQSLVDSTLDTISNMWNDLTSWFSNMQAQSVQDNASEVQRYMKSIHDSYVLERMAGDFAGTVQGAGSAGRLQRSALRGDQTDFLKKSKDQQPILGELLKDSFTGYPNQRGITAPFVDPKTNWIGGFDQYMDNYWGVLDPIGRTGFGVSMDADYSLGSKIVENLLQYLLETPGAAAAFGKKVLNNIIQAVTEGPGRDTPSLRPVVTDQARILGRTDPEGRQWPTIINNTTTSISGDNTINNIKGPEDFAINHQGTVGRSPRSVGPMSNLERARIR